MITNPHGDRVPQEIRVTFPVPFCPMCGHDVDRFEMIENPVNGKVTLVAHCHGDVDEKTYYQEELVNIPLKEFFKEESRYMLKGREMIERKTPMTPMEEVFASEEQITESMEKKT